MSCIEQSISLKRLAEEVMESERVAKAARTESLDDEARTWTYEEVSEVVEAALMPARRSVTIVADADPLWTTRRSSTPMPLCFEDVDEEVYEYEFEEGMPPRVSPERSPERTSECHTVDCPTNLPTLQYTGHESPEQPCTLFSPEHPTEMAATEHPTVWGSQDVETAAEFETRLSHEADFAYLASTLHAWSPASPLPEDPKTFQQQDPKTLQEAEDKFLLDGCDTLA